MFQKRGLEMTDHREVAALRASLWALWGCVSSPHHLRLPANRWSTGGQSQGGQAAPGRAFVCPASLPTRCCCCPLSGTLSGCAVADVVLRPLIGTDAVTAAALLSTLRYTLPSTCNQSQSTYATSNFTGRVSRALAAAARHRLSAPPRSFRIASTSHHPQQGTHKQPSTPATARPPRRQVLRRLSSSAPDCNGKPARVSRVHLRHQPRKAVVDAMLDVMIGRPPAPLSFLRLSACP